VKLLRGKIAWRCLSHRQNPASSAEAQLKGFNRCVQQFPEVDQTAIGNYRRPQRDRPVPL